MNYIKCSGSMKRILPIMTLIVLLVDCRKAPLLSLSDGNGNQVIALQPLDDYNVQQIQTTAEAIHLFYKKQVVILTPVSIPQRWFNPEIHMYAADSIISQLSKFSTNHIVEVIGLTHHPLFTVKHRAGTSYHDAFIIGLGYQPGHACVVSDYNIHTTGLKPDTYRLRKAILHEVGHNMGLRHCPNQSCIMSEKNSGDDYCIACKNQLRE